MGLLISPPELTVIASNSIVPIPFHSPYCLNLGWVLSKIISFTLKDLKPLSVEIGVILEGDSLLVEKLASPDLIAIVFFVVFVKLI